MFELRSILCGASLTEQDDDVLCHALKLALVGGCELILAHADGDYVARHGRLLPELRARLVRWQLLPESASSADLERLGLRCSVVRVPGSPAEGLARLVAQRRPDLMVLGTEQRTGPERWVHPSISEAMARVARVPTLFVPMGAAGLVSSATGDLKLGRILVPVANWPDASLAAQLAQRLVSTLQCTALRYRTLYVGPSSDVPTLDRMHDAAHWEHRTRQGSVAATIVEEADTFGADLLAMATEGHDSLGDALLGSTAERVVRRAGCPVVVAPPPL